MSENKQVKLTDRWRNDTISLDDNEENVTRTETQEEADDIEEVD